MWKTSARMPRADRSRAVLGFGYFNTTADAWGYGSSLGASSFGAALAEDRWWLLLFKTTH